MNTNLLQKGVMSCHVPRSTIIIPRRNERSKNVNGKIRKNAKKNRNQNKHAKRNLMFRLKKTIDHHFPDLYEKIEAIPEVRNDPDYSLLDIIMAGVAMFLFKKGSRNAMNHERNEPTFQEQYERLFKAKLPHMDTVNAVMKVLKESDIERLKTELVKGLLTRKILRRHRLFGKYYNVVIDGTHVMNVPEGHCPHCLHQTFKNDTVRYFHVVVEAKLVGANGFCISLGTEWCENPEEYDKQDCEFKAFKRLAEKLKRCYPRLPVCIVADGLYPNVSFFQICEENGWGWIVTLKSGNLPSVWKGVLKRQGIGRCRSRCEHFWRHGHEIYQRYEWHTHLSYQGFTVHWWECIERVVGKRWNRFVYLTNLEDVRYQTMLELTASGRIRWKIENEGFDIQKHHGYGLGHQFSRSSMLAMKNYYQLMQIAHMMNQLFELGSLLADVKGSKESLAHIWKALLGELRHDTLDFAFLAILLARRIRIRYD